MGSLDVQNSPSSVPPSSNSTRPLNSGALRAGCIASICQRKWALPSKTSACRPRIANLSPLPAGVSRSKKPKSSRRLRLSCLKPTQLHRKAFHGDLLRGPEAPHDLLQLALALAFLPQLQHFRPKALQLRPAAGVQPCNSLAEFEGPQRHRRAQAQDNGDDHPAQ